MKVEFYQKHLDRVSRSFAICIKNLDSPFKQWVGLTYLVCRILDTVEDSIWPQSSHQITHFKKFDSLLNSKKNVEYLGQWKNEFPKDVPPSELELLTDAKIIFEDLHMAPVPVRKTIQEMVGSMSAGMQFFIRKKKAGVLKLRSIKEVNQYCFFVAGVVGEALAKLFESVDSRARVSKELVVDSHHFGLFLQKVNLLKDQLGDEVEGRFLIPCRDGVTMSLAKHADGAMRYIHSLPVDQKGYRLFCAWSLLLGLASLPYIKKSFAKRRPLKISRAETMILFKKIEYSIDSPEKIEAIFRDLLKKSGLDQVDIKAPMPSEVACEEFKNYYSGLLGNKEFKNLGLI